jgi:hypothetical protein
MILLNNVDVSIEYIRKLAEDLRGSGDNAFAAIADDATKEEKEDHEKRMERMQVALGTLTEYSDAFRSSLKVSFFLVVFYAELTLS